MASKLSMKSPDVIDKSKQIFYNVRSRAKNKQLDFDLDINWIRNNIAIKKCQLTLTPLTFNFNNGAKEEILVKHNSISVHRIDPKIGYLKENCLIISNAVNMFISNHNINNILEIANNINKNKSLIQKLNSYV